MPGKVPGHSGRLSVIAVRYTSVDLTQRTGFQTSCLSGVPDFCKRHCPHWLLLALLQEMKSLPGFLPALVLPDTKRYHREWLFLRTRHCSVHSAPAGISLTLFLPDGPDQAYLGFSLDSCQTPALSLSTHSCKVGKGPGTAFDRTAPVFPSLASGAMSPAQAYSHSERGAFRRMDVQRQGSGNE